MTALQKTIVVLLFILSVIHLSGQSKTVPAPNGNPYVAGSFDLSNYETFISPVSSPPVWLSIEHGERGEPVIIVQFRNGSLSVFSTANLEMLEEREPPILTSPDDYYRPFQEGLLKVPEFRRLRNKTRDGVPTVSSDGLFVALSGNSPAYGHSILGDRTEADGFSIFQLQEGGPGKVVGEIQSGYGAVFETLKGVLYDLTGSGRPEILVTKSDSGTGARHQVYSAEGRYLGESLPVGTGFRWNHLLGAAPLGPGGRREVVSIRTPHIGGVVEFYRFAGGRLEKAASLPGYSSHTIGSRNLEMVLIGDFNGELFASGSETIAPLDEGASSSQVELLVPTSDFVALHVLRHMGDDNSLDTEGLIGTEVNVAVVGKFPLGDKLSTNIAAFELDGRIGFVVGTSSGKIFLYRSR